MQSDCRHSVQAGGVEQVENFNAECGRKECGLLKSLELSAAGFDTIGFTMLAVVDFRSEYAPPLRCWLPGPYDLRTIAFSIAR